MKIIYMLVFKYLSIFNVNVAVFYNATKKIIEFATINKIQAK